VLITLVVAGMALVPLSLRGLNRVVTGELPPLGYLPSLGLRVPHEPFRAEVVQDLQRGQPAWVFIGDSMLGTRIDPIHLGRISSTGREHAAFLYHAATGPAWWYLAFKNQLAASGVKPRMTFVFFRDTNLTDTMFRLENQYGFALDQVASRSEPALDALVARSRRGAWLGVHRALDAAYETTVAASWMEPAVRRWFVRWGDPPPGAVEGFEWNLQQVFSVDTLRYDVGADLEAEAGTSPDFARDVDRSVLPLIMALSREHGLPVCFVRVQRRPVDNQPPTQSPALRRYVADLRQWIESNGAFFHDDTGDPELTLDLYSDGDHVGDRIRYTEIFRRRLDTFFARGAVDGRRLDSAPGALSAVEGR